MNPTAKLKVLVDQLLNLTKEDTRLLKVYKKTYLFFLVHCR